MIHPSTELRLVNPHVGYGVFASKDIPKGSVTYVQDALDIVITPDRYAALDEGSREIAEKYSYIDAQNARILSWDIAKYVNHSCDPNTMSTGWGFEIAVRDIREGEEITDEYALFNLEWEMECACSHAQCRKTIRNRDAALLYRRWDRAVRTAMAGIHANEQPLLRFMDAATRVSLEQYLAGMGKYRSVRNLLRRNSQAMAG